MAAITINLTTSQNVKQFVFPDGQPHVVLNAVAAGDVAKVIAPLTSPTEVLKLLEVADALNEAKAVKDTLVIPYLMGARYDRVMNPGDSFDLRVIADLINRCGFKNVNLFDVHSDVAMALINNAKNHNNSKLVEAYEDEDSILICPDAGAAKKIDKYFKWNSNLKDVVYCIKSRDLSTGVISLRVLEPEKCKDRNCVIIDDICDGGATFLAIANQVQPKKLTLIVSHGIFSRGFGPLTEKFQQIITSDSRPSLDYLSKAGSCPEVKVLPIFQNLN